jgi:hypothetical protein
VFVFDNRCESVNNRLPRMWIHYIQRATTKKERDKGEGWKPPKPRWPSQLVASSRHA